MKKETMYKRKFDALTLLILDDPDNFALYKQAFAMIHAKIISTKGVDIDTWAYRSENKFDSKCHQCKMVIPMKTPVFFKANIPCCPACAPPDAFESDFYKKTMSKIASAPVVPAQKPKFDMSEDE